MKTYTDTLSLAQALINIESITPSDNGCQDLIAHQLSASGFHIERHPKNQTSNLWAEYSQHNQPFIVFSGHTDVVPPGEIRQWGSPPFQATIKNNKLYGRGAADMKGGLAAMIIGCQRFIKKHPHHRGSIGFMITSDEEGDAIDGTNHLIQQLQHSKDIAYCIVGEPSSEQHIADNVKIGRRGSLYGKLTVKGQQGHIAYPHTTTNPIHRSFKALDHLTQLEWNDYSEYFLATSFQIYNIHADTGATNIIPGRLTADFNLRYSPISQAEDLQHKIESTLNQYDIDYHIDWEHASQPFFSPPNTLAQAVHDSIENTCKQAPRFNTHGGTSDGRFIAKTGCEIIELGPINQCIHQVNEHVDIDDLKTLTTLYEDILYRLIKP